LPHTPEAIPASGVLVSGWCPKNTCRRVFGFGRQRLGGRRWSRFTARCSSDDEISLPVGILNMRVEHGTEWEQCRASSCRQKTKRTVLGQARPRCGSWVRMPCKLSYPGRMPPGATPAGRGAMARAGRGPGHGTRAGS
jgi:hypothetical protein